MVIQIKEVIFGGPGTIPATLHYCEDDLQVFKGNDSRILTGSEINVYYNSKDTNYPSGFVSAIIGVDSSGSLLSQLNDWLVLPCPPYCHRLYTCNPHQSLTITEALIQLPALTPLP